MPHSKDAHLPFGVGGRAGGRTHHVASRLPLPATCLTPAILGHPGCDIYQPTAAGQGSLTPMDIAHLIQGVWEPDGDSTRRFRLSEAHPGISGSLEEKRVFTFYPPPFVSVFLLAQPLRCRPAARPGGGHSVSGFLGSLQQTQGVCASLCPCCPSFPERFGSNWVWGPRGLIVKGGISVCPGGQLMWTACVWQQECSMRVTCEATVGGSRPKAQPQDGIPAGRLPSQPRRQAGVMCTRPRRTDQAHRSWCRGWPQPIHLQGRFAQKSRAQSTECKCH